MRYLNYKTGTVGIFFASICLLLIYSLSMRYYIYLPVGIFWVSMGLIIGIIVFQINQAILSSGYIKIILLEIVLTCVVFHLIYQIPFYHSYGIDPYIDMVSTQNIINTGFIRGDPQYVNDTAYWPIIHILGGQLALITEINLPDIAKWIPSVLSIPLILVLYLMMDGIFNQKKIALMSVLLFASLQPYMLYSSLFIRETLALVLAICCIYLYLSNEKSLYFSRNLNYRALSIMCLIGTVFAHHLTSFMLVVFFIIHYIITKISDISSVRNVWLGANITGGRMSIAFILLSLISVFMHWRYYLIDPLRDTVKFATELLTPAQWGMGSYGVTHAIVPAAMDTMREILLFYGFYALLLIFAIILFVRLLPWSNNSRTETYSFSLFLFISALFALLFLYFLSEGVYPHRFETFGWLLGFGPLVFAILNYGRKWMRHAGIFLLVAFMLLNIYQIEPRIWDSRTVNTQGAVSVENYALAKTFDFSEGTIATDNYDRMTIYDVHYKLGTLFYYSDEFINIEEYDWVVINKVILDNDKKLYHHIKTETVTQMDQIKAGDLLSRNKIYESNSLVLSTLRD